MGCCSSSSINKSTTETPLPKEEEDENEDEVEESIKQVLSETPIIPRAFRISNELRRIPYSFPKNISYPDDNSLFIIPQEDLSDNYSDIRRISPIKMPHPSASPHFTKGPTVLKLNTSPNRVRSTRKTDSGESSGRRSVSPAMRRSRSPGKKGLGRSVSAGMSSDRVNPQLGGMNQCPPTTNESLENPLVSLECFIFL